MAATHKNNMENFRKALSKVPRWSFTIFTTLLILWLTLAPDPLGDDAPQLFPGADKIVHAMMFGFLTLMILLDRERSRHWKALPAKWVIGAAAASTLLGILIEVAQRLMDMGRGFEIADMVADTLGTVICAAAWYIAQRRWSISK